MDSLDQPGQSQGSVTRRVWLVGHGLVSELNNQKDLWETGQFLVCETHGTENHLRHGCKELLMNTSAYQFYHILN